MTESYENAIMKSFTICAEISLGCAVESINYFDKLTDSDE